MATHALKLPLFLTRLSIAIFLAPWVYMRLTQVEAGKGLFAKYYKIPNMPDIVAMGIAGLWLIVLIAFVLGFKKKLSYGLVLLFHTVGTLFTIPYLIPGTENFNILFYAAIPTIAAMLLLYIVRDEDTMLAVDNRG